MSQYGNLLYNVTELSKKPNWTPTRTPMRDPAEIAKQLGITYDYDSIYNKFADATKAQYDVQRKEQQASENKYYSDVYNTQMSALDTIKKSNAEAVATGASRGMQAANELSSILGLQQESVAGATQLAADRATLADKETAALAQNAVDALSQSNSTALSLGNLNANLYASDTQFDVGQMDYYARLDAAIKNLMGMQEQANANRYGADKNLEGAKYTADKNYAAALAAAAAASSGGGYSGGSGGSYSNTSADTIRDLQWYAKNGQKADFITVAMSTGNTTMEQAEKMYNDTLYAIGTNNGKIGYSLADSSKGVVYKPSSTTNKKTSNKTTSNKKTYYDPYDELLMKLYGK